MNMRSPTQTKAESSFTPVQTGLLQRQCSTCGQHTIAGGECRECQKKQLALQRSATNQAELEGVPPIVHEVLNSPGQPLDSQARTHMESRFGYDFSQVKVHTSERAAESARAISAEAYTFKHDIVFGRGQFRPNTHSGRQLLAHELAHVVQQSQSEGEAYVPSQNGSLEAEAQSVASAITNSSPINIKGSSRPRIALAPPPKSDTLSTPRSHGLTAAEKKLLNEVRVRLIPDTERTTAIVGVLIAEDGRQFELRSGGGQGFSSHVEGKATAKMVEMGITKATLLVEKEPCQICDRSVYPADVGPEAPLKSSVTGKEIAKQTPKINTALPIGYELTVVDPESAGIYRGVQSSPAPVKTPTGGAKSSPKDKGHEPGKKLDVDAAKKPSASGSKPPASVGVEDTPKAVGAGAKPGKAAPTGTGGTATVAKEVSNELRAAARAAAKEVAADFKILRVAKGLTAAINIISFIDALQTLTTFTQMTMNSLAGKGFILTKEIAEAEKLEKESASLERNYLPFSDQLTEKQLHFFRAALDPLAAGQAASSISELKDTLDILKVDLGNQLKRVNATSKEAEAKQKAAESILNDPKASAAIAAVTFGTAELAALFAASQDLQRIASALRSTSVHLTKVKNQVSEDVIFIDGWYEGLFEVCRKGGVCSLRTIDIPFVGTSKIHILPGEG